MASSVLVAGCVAPAFQPSIGPGAPVPGTYGSAPAIMNMACAQAGERFFNERWQQFSFGGSRRVPNGTYEVILNSADGRRALCVVSDQGVVLNMVPI
jgi:hypothetical protein